MNRITLLGTILKKKENWIVHAIRRKRILTTVLEATVEGKTKIDVKRGGIR